jgi:hypothetical protein
MSDLGQSWAGNGQLLPFTLNDASEHSPISGVPRTMASDAAGQSRSQRPSRVVQSLLGLRWLRMGYQFCFSPVA